MKNIGLAAAACCLAVSAAVAADLPSRRQPASAPLQSLADFSWTGFYAGVNAGYAFDNYTNYGISANTPLGTSAIALGQRPGFLSTRASGFTGGGQIGYNYEIGDGRLSFGNGGLVAGLEADAAYTNLHKGAEFDGPLGVDRADFASRLDFLGTVRGRLGVAFGNLLVFGTGGFAYGGANDNVAYYFSPTQGPNYLGRSDTIRAGVAYGGGIEYAIPTASFLNPFRAAAVTVKAEYLRYDLGTSTFTMNNLLGSANSYTVRVHDAGNLARAGLNYKFDFGGSLAPVVARY